ncbi:MAG: DUF2203 domain-containing protein [Archangiaceae bacterium]|nr:DUF2203 domain-containing protein [Archangiaceae bacterium]
MRLFGLAEANAYVPMLNQTFTRVRALLDAGERDEAARVLEELEQLGIEVKAPDGLVDFNAMRDGEVVYLCWKFPEETISHWHRRDSGFAGRKAIAESDGFVNSWAN